MNMEQTHQPTNHPGKMKLNHKQIKGLLRIRNVEQAFLDLFGQGRLNGTVHTCIGQELSALAFAGQVKKTDFVFSNHRCHGHFIAYTKEWKGLILELLGKKEGICAGVGSSQHLQLYNFFSNGIQGGIMPVAAGYALGNKLKKNNAVGVVYIGDGTLGEGVVYETLNFISKKQIPLLVVCENNRYAQSTPIDYSLAGSIELRARAFGIEFRESSTADPEVNIFAEAQASIDYIRQTGRPVFHLVNTYRLRAHSKGDDDRDKAEIDHHENLDLLNMLRKADTEYFNTINKQVKDEIWAFIKDVIGNEEMGIDEYYQPASNQSATISYSEYEPSGNRQVADLNNAFHSLMEDEKTVFLGEDIVDPYGGAFKVSKGLSTKYPDRVIGTSISEGLIAGVANGLALNGFKPYAEFMFGDFTALAFDQMVNHAAKFYNMYNKKITCPVVFRTPMGGKRGYGPTHSQSLEKHFVGMDTFEILALNVLLNPAIVYQYAQSRVHPTLVIENKVDYGKKAAVKLPEGYGLFISTEAIPNLLIKPTFAASVTTTIVTYGGNVETAIENIEKIFFELDELVQVLVLTRIDPLPIDFLLTSIPDNTKVITIEEGTARGTIGDTIISFVARHKAGCTFKSISSLNATIPSVKSLEEKMLANQTMLLRSLSN